jgi:GTPase
MGCAPLTISHNFALFKKYITVYSTMGKEKVHISLVVIGHVDAGKSSC